MRRGTPVADAEPPMSSSPLLEQALEAYLADLKSTDWVDAEIYKLEWAHELAARVDWAASDEVISDVAIEALGERFGDQADRGVNFLTSGARRGKPLMTPSIVAQLRRLETSAFADLDWAVTEAITCPMLSCYAATLFPERLRPIHGVRFPELFERWFGADYEPLPKIGLPHVLGVQPYLERVAEAIERADAPLRFLAVAEARYEALHHEEPPFAFDPSRPPGRLVSNWIVQDFCYHALRPGGETRAGEPDARGALGIESALEGKLRRVVHRRRERSLPLAREAKRRAYEKDPALPCEACGTSLREVYGEAADGVIEAHHVEPLGERTTARETRLEDFAMLCPNCHAMVHRPPADGSVDAVRKMIRDRPRRGRAA